MKRKTVLVALAIAASSVGFVTLAGAGLSSTTNTNATQSRTVAETQRPKIIAVKFHADWCGYCKAMGPVFEELQAKYDQEPVLYVVLDQTREFDRTQSQFMANAMGLDSVWEEHGGKTGFVLLIDASTKEVVQRLSYEQNLKQMGAALKDAVRSAP